MNNVIIEYHSVYIYIHISKFMLFFIKPVMMEDQSSSEIFRNLPKSSEIFRNKTLLSLPVNRIDHSIKTVFFLRVHARIRLVHHMGLILCLSLSHVCPNLH